MRKKQRNLKKDILFILASSFVVVVAWIGFNIYHIWVTSTIGQEIQPQLTPIDPEFDPATIQQLRTREQIDPLYDKQTVETKDTTAVTGTPTPTITAPVEASSSSLLTPTNEPTISIQGQ